MRELAVVPVRKPLRPSEVLRRIMNILRSGEVEVTHHCGARMTERHVDMLDVEQALYSGVILRNRVWDAEHENWKYRVESADIEGVTLTVIVVVDEAEQSLRLVTVF